MNIESPARARELEAPVGSEELAEGLMLVRASNLKMIRFQLAMERNDRRVALETVDDLVALDRRLQDYIEETPGASKQLLFRKEVDADRALLNREKMTLAAEIVRVERAPEPAESPAWEEFEFAPDEEERHPYRALIWVVIVFGLLAAAAGGAWMFFGPQQLLALVQGSRRTDSFGRRSSRRTRSSARSMNMARLSG
jgi:hypothetical protein